jgi:hypothetical protein
MLQLYLFQREFYMKLPAIEPEALRLEVRV